VPHICLIGPAGRLEYADEMNSEASPNSVDIAGTTNDVIQAIDEVDAGKPVSKSITQPYGYSVKYSTTG